MAEEAHDPCEGLADQIAHAFDPAAFMRELLNFGLPCPPLELLVNVHQLVLMQSNNDPLLAEELAAASKVLADTFPNEAILQAQASWTEAIAVFHKPDYALSLERFDRALAWYEKACLHYDPDPPPRDIRIVEVVRVACLSELGRLAEAQFAAERAQHWIETEQKQGSYAELVLQINIAQLAGRVGDYRRMLALSKAILPLAEQFEDGAAITDSWTNQAYAAIFLGDFAAAEQALEHATVAANASREGLGLARISFNRARLLRYQGQLFAALNALHAARKDFAEAQNEEATVLLEQASLYEQLRQLPAALKAAQTAATSYAELGMSAYAASAALTGARIALQLRQFKDHEKLLQLARNHAQGHALREAEIALAQAARPTANRQQTLARRTQAETAVAHFTEVGLLREAAEGTLIVAHIDQARGKVGAPLAMRGYRQLLDHPDQHVQMAAHSGLGTLLAPAQGLPHVMRAAELATARRRTLPVEELQARYSSDTSHYHLQLAACYLALGQPEQALAAIWQAKAGPLLDLRAATGSLAAEDKAELERLRANIVRCRQQSEQQAQQTILVGQRRAAPAEEQPGQDTEAFWAEQLAELAGRLGDKAGAAEVPSYAVVAAALPVATALLEFVVIDNEIMGFLIQQGQPVAWQRLGSAETIERWERHWPIIFKRIKQDPDTPNAAQQITQNLQSVAQQLIAPWQTQLNGIAQLVIAPFGTLHHLPWAALPFAEQYLAERFTLALTPAGAMLGTRVSAEEAVGPPRILGYPGSGKHYLPHVQHEIASVAALLPHAQASIAATANELRATPAPRLLHIASHALTRSDAPLTSTLELADGPFMLLDAHRLRLRGTELVTLSACETGVRPNYGEMALALPGAFLCAGAAQVLASLWPVGDGATAELMAIFYQALANDNPSAVALRTAQLHMRTKAPLDWAAFQLWLGTEIA
jgi:CHAT domain-containing protein/tetratricopeptide (TPR) repeat protein